MKKNLIIYQSIAEIFEIVNILKKHSYGKCVIIVTGGKHFLSVLERLKLKKKYGVIIYEFHGLSLKNPISLVKMYYMFNYSTEYKEFLSYSFDKAYFFNKIVDFVAPIFLCQKNIKTLVFIDFYKFRLIKKKIKIGLKHLIQKIIIKILFKNINAKITFYKLFPGNRWIVMYFYNFGKKIYHLPKSTINKNYFFDLQQKKEIINKKKIIYLDSDDETAIGSEFKNVILKIFRILEKQNYHIVIKKHPRAKLSNIFFQSKKWTVITDPMPIELLNLKKVVFIFGFFSTGLVKISQKYPNIDVCSIINLFSLKIRKEFSKAILIYHNQLTDKNKVKYPSDFEELREIILKKNFR